MSDTLSQSKRHQPAGWPTIIPRIITRDVDGLVGFMRTVFNADCTRRGEGPAELRIGDSIVMVSNGDGLREARSAFLYVYVEDADEIYRRAIKAGAHTVEEPLDMPYGDRRAMVRDAWGNLWQIATHHRQAI
ncbi:VOC family protein [Bradyrhizobium sp. NP1]|uniref:VOC family protein n=1 Tax=Bradyrhizobium sp. NP1 TaxID=3049772 RepID=UPI0025A51A91|nr:VOC family protein [Bradyrhizobium sp. NP1]WJR80637.1 VOC family protein [Bradyrhizobium sp. NP1]